MQSTIICFTLVTTTKPNPLSLTCECVLSGGAGSDAGSVHVGAGVTSGACGARHVIAEGVCARRTVQRGSDTVRGKQVDFKAYQILTSKGCQLCCICLYLSLYPSLYPSLYSYTYISSILISFCAFFF